MKRPLPCSTNWNFGLGQSKAHALMLWISLFMSKEHHLGDAFPTKHDGFFQRALLWRGSISMGIHQVELSGEQESLQWWGGQVGPFSSLLQAVVSSLQLLNVPVNRGKNTNQDGISKFNQDGISKFNQDGIFKFLLNLSRRREQDTHPQPHFIPLSHFAWSLCWWRHFLMQ